MTNLELCTGEQVAAVEHWYRHRTEIENIFRDAKIGAALRHLPSGYIEVNTARMWGALLAASTAGWLHQLVATSPTTNPDPTVTGYPSTPKPPTGPGVRDGKAMIATLRHRLLCIPGRLIHHADQLILSLPPGHHLLTMLLTRLRARRREPSGNNRINRS